MIPKVIHYCWFGGNKLDKGAKKCIKSWKKYCPSFQIVQWNESNFDISATPKYVRDAYAAKKWAFVTDYVRLFVVNRQGGIYLDTDVELIKSLDFLLKYDAFFGFEDYSEKGLFFVSTGQGFGAKAGNELVQSMMRDYETLSFIKDDGTYNYTACPHTNTHVFAEYGFNLNDKTQTINNVILMDHSYMCPKQWQTGAIKITENTISIHHFGGSWTSKKRTFSFTIKSIFRKIIGERLYLALKEKRKKENK